MLNKDNLLTEIFIFRSLPGSNLAGIHGATSTELARPVHVPAVEVVTDPGGDRVNLRTIRVSQSQPRSLLPDVFTVMTAARTLSG